MAAHPSHEHPLEICNPTTLYQEYEGRWKCDTCGLEYESTSFPYHCNTCSFDLCSSCFETKQHVRHEHPLYLMLMENVYPQYHGEWKCDGCGQNKLPTSEPTAYHCFHDSFDLCKDCFDGHQTGIHSHPLKPADAAILYNNVPGLWVCDICRRTGTQLGTRFSWHCSVCEFDCCNNCLQQIYIPDHPHPLKITDSNMIYPNYDGRWGCDICAREMNPATNELNTNRPYHCNHCEFDACHDCIRLVLQRDGPTRPPGTIEPIDEVGRPYDETGPPARPGNSSRPSSASTRPHHPPVETLEDDNINVENLDDSQKCIVCFARPKNATIVHQHTGHVCCCLTCAYTLFERGDKCPICRAEIDTVIKHFNS